jgi:hypothetical protein
MRFANRESCAWELGIGAVDEVGAVPKGGDFDVASGEYIREEIRTPQEIFARDGSWSRVRKTQVFGHFSEVTDDMVVAALSMQRAVTRV